MTSINRHRKSAAGAECGVRVARQVTGTPRLQSNMREHGRLRRGAASCDRGDRSIVFQPSHLPGISRSGRRELCLGSAKSAKRSIPAPREPRERVRAAFRPLPAKQRGTGLAFAGPTAAATNLICSISRTGPMTPPRRSPGVTPETTLPPPKRRTNPWRSWPAAAFGNSGIRQSASAR